MCVFGCCLFVACMFDAVLLVVVPNTFLLSCVCLLFACRYYRFAVCLFPCYVVVVFVSLLLLFVDALVLFVCISML